MRTTVDIADTQYSRLKIEAAKQQTSVKALISHGVDLVLQERARLRAENGRARPRWPVIRGGNPAMLARVTNDAMFGPDDGE